MTFREKLQSGSSQSSSWPALDKFRQEALSSLEQTGLPTRRNEDWKYTSLRGLDKVDSEHFALSSEKSTIIQGGDLTIENGTIRSECPELKEAGNSKYADKVLKVLESDLDRKDFTEMSNLVTLRNAYVLEVEKDLDLKIIDRAQEKGVLKSAALFIFIADGANLSLSLESNVHSSSYANTRFYFALDQNSKVKMNRYLIANEDSNAFYTTSANLSEGAEFYLFDFMDRAKLLRNEVRVSIEGSGAHAELQGIYLGERDNHTDNFIVMDHKAPEATSVQNYRGILSDQSRAVFSGAVKVRQIAQKTDASQLNKTLVLSDESEIDAKPQLEIDADDVKCGHGAAIAQINPDELFYLQSRGYTKEQAKETLITAFIAESIQMCHDDEERTRLFAYMADKDLNYDL